MKRRNYNDKEQDQLQKLKHENSKLKKQVSALRKQLTRVDLDRYENLKQMSEEMSEKFEQESKDYLGSLKKEWECHDCNEGYLQISLISQVNRLMYYRTCTNCKKRTRLKPYTSDVKGIKEE